MRKWTLGSCVVMALARNPGARSAHWDARRAAEHTREARGYRQPSLSAHGSYDRFDRDQRIHLPHRPELGTFDNDIFGYGVAARMPLFRGGRLVNSVRLAEAEEAIAGHDLQRTRDEVVFDVTRAFYRGAALTKVLDSTRASLDAMKAHQKLVAHQVEVGRAARVDLLRIRVRVADLRQQTVRVQSDRDVALHLLSALMGIDETIPPDELSYELAFAPRPIDTQHGIARALANRPDYQAAQQAVVAQQKRLRIARAGHWPEVDLRASYTGRGGDNLNMDENWRGGIEVRVPLFEGGRVRSRVAQARLALRSTKAQARQVELRVRHEVRTACLRLRSAAESVRATETAVTEAEESLAIERRKYETGRATLTDVLDAQAAWLRAQTSYFESLAQHRVAWAELTLATGGGGGSKSGEEASDGKEKRP